MGRTSSLPLNTPTPPGSPGRTLSPCRESIRTPAPLFGSGRTRARRRCASKKKGRDSRPSRYYLGCPSYLDGGDVLRLHALLATGRLVGDLGALFEGPEPAAG